MSAGLAIFTMIFAALLTHEALSQTEWIARYTCVAPGDQYKPSIARPSRAGEAVTVWEDERHQANSGSDIYIQMVDAGTGISRWIADAVSSDVVTDRFDGILVCDAENDQRNPRAAYDGMGGVIVVWEDYRNDPSNTVADIYAQRFDLSTGRPDPGWPVNGVAVCQTGAHAERPRIAGTVDGAYITWIDYRNDNGTPPRNRDVFLQYIKSTTASWPPPPSNWVANGISVSVLRDPDQINPELDVDHTLTLDLLGLYTEGVVVTWQDNRRRDGRGQQYWNVYANHISADGQQMFIPVDVSVTNPTNAHQEYPRIVTTGRNAAVPDRRAVIVWQDHRPDPIGGVTDVYAQALLPGGMAMFGPMGGAVCIAPGSQRYPQPVLWEHVDQQTQAFTPYVTVGWEDYRDAATTGTDIYGGLLDATGPAFMVNPQGALGDAICQLPGTQGELAMDNVYHTSLVNENTVFAWRHEVPAGDDIWYQEINLPGWAITRPANGWPVTEARSVQSVPDVSRRMFIWQDGRRDSIPNDNQDDENIYCQTPGECTGPTAMSWRDEFAMWTFGESARDHRYVSDPSDGSTYHVWVEDREVYSGNFRPIVFIQKLDKDGVPRWSNNGVSVSVYHLAGALFSMDVEKPDVCINGAGGAWVIWKQYTALPVGYPAQYECPMLGINEAGALTLPKLGSNTWGIGSSTCTSPRILSDGAGGGVYGVIRDFGPDYKPYLGTFNSGGAAGLAFFIADSPAIQPDEELQVSYDGGNFIYALTRSTIVDSIIVGYVHKFGVLPPYGHAAIPYAAFDSYDLLHQDYLLSTGSAALFTYAISSAAGEPFNVHVGLYRPGTTVFTAPVTTHTAGSGFSATQPAISPDSTINPATGEQGVLLAWNTYRNTPPVPPHHRVESNRYTFTSGWYPAYTMATEFPVPLILEDGLGVATHPDIARVFSGTATQAPRAVVVWEGGGETSPCSPPRPTDIRGQFVFYDASAPNAGPQWTTPEMIAPGPGNYHQTRPAVLPSLPEAVSVFWYDSQNGDIGILGTRLPGLREQIQWAKRDRGAGEAGPAEVDIAGMWPQPARGDGSAMYIHLRATDRQRIAVELRDMLGRVLATVFEGEMLERGLVLSINPATLRLVPGTYVLAVRGANTLTSKTFTILR